jgi:hypothetical protein
MTRAKPHQKLYIFMSLQSDVFFKRPMSIIRVNIQLFKGFLYRTFQHRIKLISPVLYTLCLDFSTHKQIIQS